MYIDVTAQTISSPTKTNTYMHPYASMHVLGIKNFITWLRLEQAFFSSFYSSVTQQNILFYSRSCTFFDVTSSLINANPIFEWAFRRCSLCFDRNVRSATELLTSKIYDKPLR